MTKLEDKNRGAYYYPKFIKRETEDYVLSNFVVSSKEGIGAEFGLEVMLMTFALNGFPGYKQMSLSPFVLVKVKKFKVSQHHSEYM